MNSWRLKVSQKDCEKLLSLSAKSTMNMAASLSLLPIRIGREAGEIVL